MAERLQRQAPAAVPPPPGSLLQPQPAEGHVRDQDDDLQPENVVGKAPVE
jgi:hypothetical protein